MADTTTEAAYTIKIEAPSNGRLRKSTVTARSREGKTLCQHKDDMADAGRRKATAHILAAALRKQGIETTPEEVGGKIEQDWNNIVDQHQRMHQQGILRSQAEVARFFDGLDLLEPGVVRVQEWRPGSETEARSRSNMWGGAARKA